MTPTREGHCHGRIRKQSFACAGRQPHGQSEQTELPGQFGEVRPSGLVTLGINSKRASIYVELLREMHKQRWWRHFIRLQHDFGFSLLSPSILATEPIVNT